MTEVLPEIRRIVTAINADGKSYVAEVGPSPAVRTVVERPGYRVTNIWRTLSTPVDVSEPDTITAHAGVLPPQNGTVVRIIDYPPESRDPEEVRRQQLATFRTLYPDADHRPQGNHPGLHETRTVDYAIVLEGEITAVLDTEKLVLRSGDVLVQRATMHGWANRSDAMARIAFILIDGR
ncbi:cupin domain-containing protein [Rhizobium sp. P38BS-XIX]|nr:cupin domain-containing protein [Rhizobium sp. P38BS-XIX]